VADREFRRFPFRAPLLWNGIGRETSFFGSFFLGLKKERTVSFWFFEEFLELP